MDKIKGLSPNHVFVKSQDGQFWPYPMQIIFWMDKIMGPSPNHVFLQRSRRPYVMQSKFRMGKIQGSRSGYMYYSLSGKISTLSKR